MYDVVTISKAKDAFLQIRIREDIKQELAILAESRGLSMSALINTWAVKAIRDEKSHSPELFHQSGVLQQFEQGIRVATKSKGPAIAMDLEKLHPTEKKRKTG